MKKVQVISDLDTVSIMPGECLTLWLHRRDGGRPIQVECHVKLDGTACVILAESDRDVLTTFAKEYG